MSLGLSIYKMGYHKAAWRMPDFPSDSMMSFAAFAQATKDAEAAKLDFVFFADIQAVENADNPQRDISLEHYVVKLDPIVAMSALSALTTNIGFIGTISSTYSEPYKTARLIASLDVISSGRAGWNVVTSYSIDEARNFGLTAPSDATARYARAEESVEVVKALWNSWDDDAFLVDKQSGRYFDRSKMRLLDHHGTFFNVRGPLDVAPSPQGAPVVVSAGDSPLARTFAARHANIQYAPTRGDLGAAKAYYKDVKSQMAAFGRHPDELRILPGIMPFVGVTEADAIRKRDHIRSLIHPEVGFGLLRPLFGDLAAYATSEKLAKVVDGSGLRGAAKSIFDRAAADELTIKQVYEDIGDGEPWFMTTVGSAMQVADLMQQWVEEYAADGFNLLPHYMPGGLNDFLDLVVPELQRRGLFRTEYKGTTLRQTLHLPTSI